MGELVEMAHVGWQCRTKHCRVVFAYVSTGDLDADRADSRAKAEAEGWLFLPETRYRSTGRAAVRHYCPRCAPIAIARADLREAERKR
jgi:hypothetical protein